MELAYHQRLTEPLQGKYGRVADRLAPRSRVLEIGCHTGYFSVALRDRRHDVVGVEYNREAAAVAEQAGIRVVVADVERPGSLSGLPGPFDAVLLMDVLEHLREPVQLLRDVKSVLAPNGKVLITAPNVAYWAMRKDLLLGRWKYLDGGILDRTHLRFFNAGGWRELVEQAGYRITAFDVAEGMLPFEQRLTRLPGAGRWVGSVRDWSARRFPEMFAIQFLIEAAAS